MEHRTPSASDPVDLVAFVTHTLGFVPQRSLVLVCLTGPEDAGRLGAVVRLDLRMRWEGAGARAALENLAVSLDRWGARTVAALVFPDGAASAVPLASKPTRRASPGSAGSDRDNGGPIDQAPDDEDSAWSRVVVALAAIIDIPVLGWVVRGGDLQELIVSRAGVSPGAQRLAPGIVSAEKADLAAPPIATRGGGRALHPQISPDEARRKRAQRAQRYWWQRRSTDGGLDAWRESSFEAWEAALRVASRRRTSLSDGDDGSASDTSRQPTLETLTAATCGRVIAGLRDIQVRDAVLMSLLGASASGAGDQQRAAVWCSPSRADAKAVFDAVLRPGGVAPDPVVLSGATAVLLQTAAHASRGTRAPSLALLGWLEWWLGDSRAAAVWFENALADDPAYRLAVLSRALVTSGMRPAWLCVA